MNWQELLTDGVVIAVLYGIFRVVELHWNKRQQEAEIDKAEAEAEHTDQETIQIQRSTITGLIRDNEDYRNRLQQLEIRFDQYERANKEKEIELKALREENDALKTNVDELKSAFKDLLQYLKDLGVEIPNDKLPRPGLLDTDPRMKAVNGRKK